MDVPLTGILSGVLGASKIERDSERDVWRVVGGWGDGIEFTSLELYEARESAAKFADLLKRKRDEFLIKQMQKDGNYRPKDYLFGQVKLWPGDGGRTVDVTADPARQRRLAPSLVDDFTQTDGTWLGIKRSTEPAFRPNQKFAGTKFQIPMERTRTRVPIPKPPEPKKVEHEEPPVLRRRYKKA